MKGLTVYGDADARAFYVVGLALGRIDDGNGLFWMGRALEASDPEGIAEQRTAIRVVSEIARTARRMGRVDLLNAAAKRYVTLVGLWPVRDPALIGDEALNPVALAVRQHLEENDFVGAYSLLTRTEFLVDVMPRTLDRMRQNISAEKLAAAVQGVSSDFRLLAEFILRHYGNSALAIVLFEKGLSQGDVPYRRRFAFILAQNGRRERALKVIRGTLMMDMDPPVRESLALLAARLHLLAGRHREACEILRSFPEPARPSHIAEILDTAGDEEGALRFYRQVEMQGYSPNIQIARLLHRLSRFEEALRYYVRDIERGSRLPVWPPEEDLGPISLRDGVPPTSLEGRAEVLKILRGH